MDLIVDPELVAQSASRHRSPCNVLAIRLAIAVLTLSDARPIVLNPVKTLYNMTTAESLPDRICGDLGIEMKLRWAVPRAWTGRDGPLGLYWSSDASIGQLHPLPDMAGHMQINAYANDLAYGVTSVSKSIGESSILAKLALRILYGISSQTNQGEISDAGIVPRLIPGKTVRFCSIGVDPLGMLSDLVRLGHDVTSVERHPIERAPEQRHAITVLPGTAGALPEALQSETFDVVAMIHSLSRELDPVAAIRSAASLLKPSGYMWIDVPNFQCAAFDVLGPSWFHADPGRHLHFFSGESLAFLVRLAGLEVKQIHHFGYSRQFYWTPVERNLWSALYENAEEARRWKAPAKPTLCGKLQLLCNTLFASPEKRHDSVRVLARKKCSL
jgi:SAM-dependent methyltransferase